MGIIKTRGLVHRFLLKNEAGESVSETAALQDINVDIEAGSFVAIIGHNGSGKTTLARHFNALLAPTEGTVWVDGKDTSDVAQTLAIRRTAGMVFQNPDNQIVASVVEEDVAFGPENLGVPIPEIWERVAESLEKTGMNAYREMSPNRLSGGQKQRIAIAGILAMKPSCMILDEPTAMLDPGGRQGVLEAVRSLNKQEGVTVILITHDMEEAALADRVIVMEKGRIFADGSPRQVLSDLSLLQRLQLGAPFAAELAVQLRSAGMEIPDEIIGEDELAEAVAAAIPVHCIRRNRNEEELSGTASERHAAESHTAERYAASPELIRLEDISFYYGKGLRYEKHALKDISLQICAGERIALIGPTGSGKSTFLEVLGGLAKPFSGKVFYEGEEIREKGYSRKQLCRMTGMVFQYPEYQLFGEDVLTDVMFGPRNLGLSETEAKDQAIQALRMMGIDEKLFSKSPFSLSGGEKRRVAIAGVLAMHPRVLLLDEPAAGLDASGKKDLEESLLRLQKEEGLTLVQTSHSMEDAAEYAERVIVLHEGQIFRDGLAEEVFRDTESLETIGLAAPRSIYLMRKLSEKGIPVRENAITLSQAREEILSCLQRAESRSVKETGMETLPEKGEEAGHVS